MSRFDQDRKWGDLQKTRHKIGINRFTEACFVCKFPRIAPFGGSDPVVDAEGSRGERDDFKLG
jgi:hypothetical protein